MKQVAEVARKFGAVSCAAHNIRLAIAQTEANDHPDDLLGCVSQIAIRVVQWYGNSSTSV